MADVSVAATPVSAVKPGIKTTEFALTVFLNLVTIAMTFIGMVPASWATIILAVVNSIYTIMRAIIKNGDPAYQVPALPAGVVVNQ